MGQHNTHLVKKMRERGWSEDELAHAHFVMEHAPKKENHRLLDLFIPWALFLLFSVLNIAGAFLLVPLLLIFPNNGVYAITVILGFVFGLLLEVLLRDTEHVFKNHHHYLLFVFLPYITIISTFLIITYFDSHFSNIFLLTRNPIAVGVIYVISFFFPIALFKFLIPKYRHHL